MALPKRKGLPKAGERENGMTRSITIVNTSNWPNEDYVVTAGSFGPQRLKPGESMQVTGQPVQGIEILAQPADSDAPQEFTPVRVRVEVGEEGLVDA